MYYFIPSYHDFGNLVTMLKNVVLTLGGRMIIMETPFADFG